MAAKAAEVANAAETVRLQALKAKEEQMRQEAEQANRKRREAAQFRCIEEERQKSEEEEALKKSAEEAKLKATKAAEDAKAAEIDEAAKIAEATKIAETAYADMIVLEKNAAREFTNRYESAALSNIIDNFPDHCQIFTLFAQKCSRNLIP